MTVLTIAAQLAFLGLKCSRFGQSNNYDTTLVKGQGSFNGFKAIFRQQFLQEFFFNFLLNLSNSCSGQLCIRFGYTVKIRNSAAN